jgi:hypothetical protein
MLDDFPPKPKGMHWKRYERLRRRHNAETEQAFGMTAAWLLQFKSKTAASG